MFQDINPLDQLRDLLSQPPPPAMTEPEESPDLQMLRQRLTTRTPLDTMSQMTPQQIQAQMWEQEYGPRAKGKFGRGAQDFVIAMAELAGHKKPDFSSRANQMFMDVQRQNRIEDADINRRYVDAIKSHDTRKASWQRYKAAEALNNAKDTATKFKGLESILKNQIDQKKVELEEKKLNSLDELKRIELSQAMARFVKEPSQVAAYMESLDPDKRAQFWAAYKMATGIEAAGKLAGRPPVAMGSSNTTIRFEKTDKEDEMGNRIREAVPTYSSRTNPNAVAQQRAQSEAMGFLMGGAMGQQLGINPMEQFRMPQGAQQNAMQPRMANPQMPRPTTPQVDTVVRPGAAPREIPGLTNRLRAYDGRHAIKPAKVNAELERNENNAIMQTNNLMHETIKAAINGDLEAIVGGGKQFGASATRLANLGAKATEGGVLQDSYNRVFGRYTDNAKRLATYSNLNNDIIKAVTGEIFALSGKAATDMERAYIGQQMPAISDNPDTFLMRAVLLGMGRSAAAKTMQLRLFAPQDQAKLQPIVREIINNKATEIYNAVKQLKLLKSSQTADKGEIARLEAQIKNVPSGDEIMWEALKQIPGYDKMFYYGDSPQDGPKDKLKKTFRQADIDNRLLKGIGGVMGRR